ncbi:MAG: kinesin, partial [Parvibaculum sedimenti]
AWPDASRPADTSRNWGISDLLAAAERLPDRDAPPKPGELTDGMSDSEFHRSSLQVIETLQALAVDLDRALEQSPPAELWQRYQAGERNVFARRLYNIAGRQLYDRIAVKYRGDEEFRDHVDRFVSLFERLLASASTRDRENILAETYLTSDTGKAYLILAQASGKLA